MCVIGVIFMRLFLAVGFDTEIRDALCEAIRRLRACCESGRFTERENLHLTLVFLGEVPAGRVGFVKEAMEQARIPAFMLCIGGVGFFRRPGGDICWAGVERSGALAAAYGELCGKLAEKGFGVEKRPYRPHLTLGREIVLKEDCRSGAFDVPPMKMKVEAVSLMRSDRPEGKLKYTEIYIKRLEEEMEE